MCELFKHTKLYDTDLDHLPTFEKRCIIAVILFGIFGSYLFFYIWENILRKLGK